MPSREWNVLLIGGAPCTGKTRLARDLSRHFDVPVFEGDILRTLLRDPMYLAVDADLSVFAEPGFWQLPLQDRVAGADRLSRRLCKVAEQVVARQAFLGLPLILEAAWILPEFATQSLYAGLPCAGVHSIFLSEPRSEVLARRMEARTDPWWQSLNQEQKATRLSLFHAQSLALRLDARTLHLPVLDCEPIDSLFSRALDALSGCADADLRESS